MSSLGRKTLFYLFAGLFLILVPIVFLYGQGYRVNLEERRLTETGSIYIETTPRRAGVSVDGEIQDDSTPMLLNELQPGNKLVEVYRDGYHTWRQLAKVEAKKSVLYSAVELFRSEPIKEVLVEDVVAIHESRTGRYILIEKDDVMALYNTAQNELVWAQPHPEAGVIEWSLNERWILLSDDVSYSVLDRESGLVDQPFENFSKINRVHLLNDDIALITKQGEIIELNILTQEVVSRTSISQGLDAMKNDGGLWILQDHSGRRVIKQEENRTTYAQENLPDTISQFYPSTDPLILIDESGTEAWQINEEAQVNVSQLSDNFISYQNQGKFELYTYTHELISNSGNWNGTLVRQAEPITDAEWYQDTGYILYLSNGTVYAHDVLYEPYANTFALTQEKTQAMAGSLRKGFVYVLQDGTFSRLEIQ